MISFISTVTDYVLIRQLRSGRLRPEHWPTSLRILGVAAGLLTLTGVLATIAAPLWRQSDQLIQVSEIGYLPQTALPLLNVTIFLALVLFQTAALHIGWPGRIIALISAASILMNSSITLSQPLLMAALSAFVLLLLLHLVRLGASFHPAELLVTGILLFVMIQVPMLFAVKYGFDTRGLNIHSGLQHLVALAMPALIVAGTVLTQLAVSGGVAVGQASRAWSYRAKLWLLAGLLVWNSATLPQVFGEASLKDIAEQALGAVLTLGIAFALSWPLFRNLLTYPSWGQSEPEELTEAFSGLSFMWVALSTCWVMLPLLGFIVNNWLDLQGFEPWVALEIFGGLPNMALSPNLSRVAAAGVALIVLWKRQSDWRLVILTIAFLALQLVLLGTQLWGGVLPIAQPQQLVPFLLHLGCLAETSWLLFKGRLTSSRLTPLVAATAILALYEIRHILADPLAWVFGFSTMAVVMFGLLWRLATDGEFTHADTPGFPRNSRVMLYLANGLLAVAAVAFAALSGWSSTSIDLEAWEGLGDHSFAQPLLVVSLFAMLLGALKSHPQPPPHLGLPPRPSRPL